MESEGTLSKLRKAHEDVKEDFTDVTTILNFVISFHSTCPYKDSTTATLSSMGATLIQPNVRIQRYTVTMSSLHVTQRPVKIKECPKIAIRISPELKLVTRTDGKGHAITVESKDK